MDKQSNTNDKKTDQIDSQYDPAKRSTDEDSNN